MNNNTINGIIYQRYYMIYLILQNKDKNKILLKNK